MVRVNELKKYARTKSKIECIKLNDYKKHSGVRQSPKIAKLGGA